MVLEAKMETKVHDLKTLGHFLSSALHLEEQFSNSVYRDYLDREDWPAELSPDVFDQIRQRLKTLIEDSAKHEQMLHGLSRDCLGNENKNKQKIVRELELMEGFELSARDFYRRISLDPQFDDEDLREAFQNLADAEHRHAEIVREIIDLVNGTFR